MSNDSVLKFIDFIENRDSGFSFISSDFKGIKYNELMSTKLDDCKNYLKELVGSNYIEHHFEDSHVILTFKKNKTYIAKLKFDNESLINSFVIEDYKGFNMVVLVIEYDGSKYYGMQKQETLPSVQGEIENAIYKMTRIKTDTIISSRTDRGVHAKGQVVAFKQNGIDASKYKYALNNILPKSIRIIDCYTRSELFNPRYDTVKKTYEYLIKKDEKNVFLNDYYCFKKINNIERMKEELRSVLGVHDFVAFSKGEKDNTVREIFEASLKEENDIIKLTFTGSGFLHNMIRFIVGALFEIDENENAPTIKELIDEKNKNKTKRIADASGLYLVKIYY